MVAENRERLIKAAQDVCDIVGFNPPLTKSSTAKILTKLQRAAAKLNPSDFDGEQDFTTAYKGIHPDTVAVLVENGISVPEEWDVGASVEDPPQDPPESKTPAKKKPVAKKKSAAKKKTVAKRKTVENPPEPKAPVKVEEPTETTDSVDKESTEDDPADVSPSIAQVPTKKRTYTKRKGSPVVATVTITFQADVAALSPILALVTGAQTSTKNQISETLEVKKPSAKKPKTPVNCFGHREGTIRDRLDKAYLKGGTIEELAELGETSLLYTRNYASFIRNNPSVFDGYELKALKGDKIRLVRV